MDTYPDLPARYSKGTLRLRRRLHIPDGTEVRVTVVPASAPARRKPGQRGYVYPNRTLAWSRIRELAGAVSLGGDALAESDALYDGD